MRSSCKEGQPKGRGSERGGNGDEVKVGSGVMREGLLSPTSPVDGSPSPMDSPTTHTAQHRSNWSQVLARIFRSFHLFSIPPTPAHACLLESATDTAYNPTDIPIKRYVSYVVGCC